MSAAVNQDFVTYVGDAVSPIFSVKDGAGAAVNIASVAEITWSVRRSLDEAILLTKKKTTGGITFVADGSDGKFQVAITALDTAGLSGYYIHEATLTDAFGNITTIAVGRMQVGLQPQWTYDATQLATKLLYRVRRLIGDVLIGDQQLMDAEVDFAIAQFGDPYLAAAECCRQVSAQYARKVDVVQGELKTNYSNQARAYDARARDLEFRGIALGVKPYAGGISIGDSVNVASNPDRYPPVFNLFWEDNRLPVGPVGQTVAVPGSPMTDTGGLGGV